MRSLFEHFVLLSDLCLTERELCAKPGIRGTEFTLVPLLLESHRFYSLGKPIWE